MSHSRSSACRRSSMLCGCACTVSTTLWWICCTCRSRSGTRTVVGGIILFANMMNSDFRGIERDWKNNGQLWCRDVYSNDHHNKSWLKRGFSKSAQKAENRLAFLGVFWDFFYRLVVVVVLL